MDVKCDDRFGVWFYRNLYNEDVVMRRVKWAKRNILSGKLMGIVASVVGVRANIWIGMLTVTGARNCKS